MGSTINLFLIFFTVTFATNILAKVRYDNFQVYKLTPKTEKALGNLKGLQDSNSGYDFWSEIRGIGQSVDVMVSPDRKFEFSKMINNEDFESSIFISDVQKLIDNESPKIRTRNNRAMAWDDYRSLDEINQFLRELEGNYTEKVKVFTVGESYEGRNILGVKVEFNPNLVNKTVFIESNIHAREWITSAVSTWILNEILTSTNETVREIVERHNWYFVPVFNPDGFEYTQIDRMWRKTRTPYYYCHGVDPNRNWGYNFNSGGASANSCTQTYRGPKAFSEKSTSTISEFIKTIGSDLEAYISLHSYSQMFLLPYGHSSAHVENYEDLYNIGKIAAEKLKDVHGTEYTVGNIVDLLYVASGGSMDWVKGTFGTKITYTYELRDKGEYGFLLPAEQILPTAEETFVSLLTILDEFHKCDTCL